MAQERINDIGIPIFDGVEYASWELRLLNGLEYKECKEPAVREITDRDTATDWNKKNLKAKTILYSTISNRQLEFIQDCTPPFEIVSKFDNMYLHASTSLQILTRGKIDDIRLNKFNSTEEFFIEFEKLCNKYKAAGGSLKDEVKIRYILKALPPEHSYIGDLIDLIPYESRNFEYS